VGFRRVRVVAQRAHSFHHVCTSVRMYEHESYWTDFQAILYWKCGKKIQVWLQSDSNTEHFILSPKYILHSWERHVWVNNNTKDKPLLPFDGNSNIIKMKRNRSLNTTNGLIAKMESSYVTTCFGLHLWPSSGYNLVALRVWCSMCPFCPLHHKIATRYNRPAPFFHPPEQTRAALYTQYFILCTLDLLG
jgi:hypothetical protein